MSTTLAPGSTFENAQPVEPCPRLWTREEFYRAVETGLFAPQEQLELIEGEIWRKVSPQRTPHATSVSATVAALQNVFPQATIRAQAPITLSDVSEPEPDITVARGSFRDYEEHHPYAADIQLVVEVADTSLALDRTRKAVLYGQAGIAEYWIVNLTERCLEIYRSPGSTGYQSITRRPETDNVSPLASPTASILVSDLLPTFRG